MIEFPLRLLKKLARPQNDSLISRNHAEKLRVFTTTVIRGSQSSETTGFLIEIDWKCQQIVQKIPIPVDTKHPLWNSRGGNRGGRGIFVYDGILYVATALSVLKFDKKLNLVGELTHPYLAGLHEIFIDNEGIWLTSTVHDLVIKLDFNGSIIDEWWGSESTCLQKILGYERRELNLKFDFPPGKFVESYEQYCQEERLHINTVWVKDEKVYVLANRKQAVIKIRPEPEEIILQDKELHSPHNGILTQDGYILINDTQNQCVRVYNLSGERVKTLKTKIFDSKRDELSQQFSKAGWQRGLAHVIGSIYLVGTSPATVFELDIAQEKIGQICKLDHDIKHCIHGLTATYGL